ncbi:ATP-binding cassette domain-containing protein [Roseomonas tokyonensis]|nr:ATP-binding cassette domain-containing protein [Falsiroseomonas tokyonensis]MBU8541099.1 ATP-binding cassette domain-containing protein [Falsiroseomonas tokyonensis]
MVRFEAVGLRYPGGGPHSGSWGPEALVDVTFALPQGSFTWLLGPSGAGKSSVLRLMHLALRPTRGEVEVLGLRTARASRAALAPVRRRIGVVFQDFRLLPYLSAFDNVALPLRLAGRPEASLRADVTEILRWVGLGARAEALPQELSGGEQQRIAIARAVVHRPALLVADEPTGNLDSHQARRLLALLREMNRLGTTVVVATHDEDLVARFPAPSLLLHDGRLHDVEGVRGAASAVESDPTIWPEAPQGEAAYPEDRFAEPPPEETYPPADYPPPDYPPADYPPEEFREEFPEPPRQANRPPPYIQRPPDPRRAPPRGPMRPPPDHG